MSQYRKKPVVIDALRWNGANQAEIEQLVGRSLTPGKTPESLSIPTLEGDLTADRGDYIIRGIKGECYPCKPDIFEATYEPV
ncbi:hypothetical protein GCM10027299_15300 [Larkinella ripae]